MVDEGYYSSFKFINNKLHNATGSDCYLAIFVFGAQLIGNILAKTNILILGRPSGGIEKMRSDKLASVSKRLPSVFDAKDLTPWYEEHNMDIQLKKRVVEINTGAWTTMGTSTTTVGYDIAVFTTRRYSFVSPSRGSNARTHGGFDNGRKRRGSRNQIRRSPGWPWCSPGNLE